MYLDMLARTSLLFFLSGSVVTRNKALLSFSNFVPDFLEPLSLIGLDDARMQCEFVQIPQLNMMFTIDR